MAEDLSILSQKLLVDNHEELLSKSEDEVRHLKAYFATGAVLTKIGKRGKPKKKRIWIDHDFEAIRWTSKRKKASESRILFRDIDRVQAGQHTRKFARFVKELGDLDPLSFSVVAGKKSLDVICNSKEEFTTWYRGLQFILLDWRKLGNKAERDALERAFNIEVRDHSKDNLVDSTGLLRILKHIDPRYRSEDVRKMLRVMRRPKHHRFSLAECLDLFRKNGYRRDIVNLFNNLLMREYEREMTQQSPSSSKFDYAAATGPKGLLQVQALLQFLHEHQREANLTVADARAIIKRFDPDNYPLMSYQGFKAYLLSADNTAFAPERATRYQDMNQPLSHYFINSSHNTYLEGDQLQSKSSVNMYIHVVTKGCRCVELDCWDGPNGEPIIYHGHTLTSRILFRDACKALAEYGFKTSPYPLILSLEVHCSEPQQEKMATYLREAFGDRLAAPLEDTCGRTSLPSPAELKGRVLVKGKTVLSSLFPTHTPGGGVEPLLRNLNAPIIQKRRKSRSSIPDDASSVESGEVPAAGRKFTSHEVVGIRIGKRKPKVDAYDEYLDATSLDSSGPQPTIGSTEGGGSAFRPSISYPSAFTLVSRAPEDVEASTTSSSVTTDVTALSNPSSRGPHRRREDRSGASDGERRRSITNANPRLVSVKEAENEAASDLEEEQAVSGHIEEFGSAVKNMDSLSNEPRMRSFSTSTQPSPSLNPMEGSPPGSPPQAPMPSFSPFSLPPPSSGGAGGGIAPSPVGSASTHSGWTASHVDWDHDALSTAELEAAPEPGDLPPMAVQAGAAPPRVDTSLKATSTPGSDSATSRPWWSKGKKDLSQTNKDWLLNILSPSDLKDLKKEGKTPLSSFSLDDDDDEEEKSSALLPVDIKRPSSASAVETQKVGSDRPGTARGGSDRSLRSDDIGVCLPTKSKGEGTQDERPAVAVTSDTPHSVPGKSSKWWSKFTRRKSQPDNNPNKSPAASPGKPPVHSTSENRGKEKQAQENGKENGDEYEFAFVKKPGKAVEASLSSVVYLKAVKFKTFEQLRGLAWYMASLKEPKADKLLHRSPLALMHHCRHQFLRVYPGALRVSSSNYNPAKLWAVGVQMVALNLQTADVHTEINRALFRKNGGCGYVLKPAFLRRGPLSSSSDTKSLRFSNLRGVDGPPSLLIYSEELYNPPGETSTEGSESKEDTREDSSHTSPKAYALSPKVAAHRGLLAGGYKGEGPLYTRPFVLKLKILSAQHLPKVDKKSVMYPFCKVSIFGAPCDKMRLKTSTIEATGFVASWDDVLEIPIRFPALAVLHITVKARIRRVPTRKSTRVAYAAIPVDCLRAGYRICVLRDKAGKKIPLSSLLCQFERLPWTKQDAVVKTKFPGASPPRKLPARSPEGGATEH